MKALYVPEYFEHVKKLQEKQKKKIMCRKWESKLVCLEKKAYCFGRKKIKVQLRCVSQSTLFHHLLFCHENYCQSLEGEVFIKDVG